MQNSKNQSEETEQKIDDFIGMLDNIMDSGVSRLKVDVSEEVESGQYEKKYHHGRCDVGSPFATGKLFNFEDGCE